MDYSALHAEENPEHPVGSSPWGASPSASPEHNRTSFEAPISPIPYNAAQTRSDYSSDHDTMAGEGSINNGSIEPTMSSENGDSDRRPDTADSMPDSVDQHYRQQQSYVAPPQPHTQNQQQDLHRHHAGVGAAQRQQPSQQGKLLAKITGLERTGRKDPILRFDVYVGREKLGSLRLPLLI